MSRLFGTVAFIGIGLIGSSLARAMRRSDLVDTIVVSAPRWLGVYSVPIDDNELNNAREIAP